MKVEGRILESQRIGTERERLLSYFGKVEKPAAVAATFNGYYFLDLIEPLGLELHLVHPWKTRAIASARIKHDKLDSRILAELLRTGFLAEAWIAPREVRQQRQLLRYRAHTVRWATRAKNAVHGIVNRNGVPAPVESLFGPKGRAFLKDVVLPEMDRWEVEGQLARLDLLEQQIRELDREIRERVKADPVALALEMIPGIGPFIALLLVAEMGDIRRFPTAKHLASCTGLVPSLYASAEHRWGGTQRAIFGILRRPQSASRSGQSGCCSGPQAGGDQLLPVAGGASTVMSKLKQVRECTWGGAWSEDRPFMCD